MRRILVAAAAALTMAVISSAFAQDWNGPYLGIVGGAALSGRVTTSDPCLVGAPCAATGTYNGVAPLKYGVGSGFVAGGEFGYNWQVAPHLVLGVEDKIGYFHQSGRAVMNAPPIGNSDTIASTTIGDWYDTATVRVGGAFGPVLLFIEGGGAVTDIKTGVRDTVGPVTIDTNKTNTEFGYAYGGGVEYAVDRNWSVKGEFLGMNFPGKINTSAQVGGFPPGTIDRVYSKIGNIETIQVGLNYHFVPPPALMPPAPAPVPAAAPAPPPPTPPRTFLVFFDFDKSVLTKDGGLVVDEAAKSFKSTGNARLELTGYTDLAGTQAYNLRLSKRRAEAVALRLEKDGVPKSVINVMWRGKENPRVPTPDGVREPQNRRVEIVM